MASSIKLLPNAPNVSYRLSMKLIKISSGNYNNYSGHKRESIYCNKQIDLTNVNSEATQMLARLMHKIFEAGIKS